MKSKYFVSKEGKQSGPYEFNRVLEMVKANQLIWSDYIFSEEKHDWTLLLEDSEFGSHFVPGEFSNKSHVTFKTHDFENDDELVRLKEKAWFVLRDGNNYGPFSKLDLIKMLQSKALFEFDYAWQLGFSTWVRIAEIEDFMPNRMEGLKELGVSEISEIFFRRRHHRAQFGSSLIVHNNKTLYKGESIEISTGGAGLIVPSNHLNLNETLFLHFKAGDGVPAFNAICQIVSKQHVKKSTTNKDLVKYGVRFTKISSQMRDTIGSFANRKNAS